MMPQINYQLTNGAIIIITLVLLASAFSVYFLCKRHHSKWIISWSAVTLVALLLPVILVLSNGSHSNETYPRLGDQDSPIYYNLWGWMTTTNVSKKLLEGTTVSMGGIIAISCASAVALASITLTVLLLINFKSIKLSKLSIIGMISAVAIVVFVILFIFAAPVLQIDYVTNSGTLFNFWTAVTPLI